MFRTTYRVIRIHVGDLKLWHCHHTWVGLHEFSALASPYSEDIVQVTTPPARGGGGGGGATTPPIQITGAGGPEGDPEPDFVAYVFVFLCSIIIFPLCKLTLSDHSQVILQLAVFPI
jgi:hypothetical protein